MKKLINSLLTDPFVLQTSGSALLQAALELKQVQFSNVYSASKADMMSVWKQVQTGEFESSKGSAEMYTDGTMPKPPLRISLQTHKCMQEKKKKGIWNEENNS